MFQLSIIQSMDLCYEFSRKRKEFGVHPKFEDCSFEVINIDRDLTIIDENAEDQNISARANMNTTSMNVAAMVDSNMNTATTENNSAGVWQIRPSTHVSIDCIPSISEHYVNTERYIAIDRGMMHKEGGWPIEINVEEFEDKKRYLRKIEMDDEYNSILLSLTKKIERCVLSNNSIDMFEEYFVDEDINHTCEPPTVKTISIFRDPKYTQNCAQPVCKVCWHPENNYRIASVHCNLNFTAMNRNTNENHSSHSGSAGNNHSYIWDIQNPNRPYFTIEPESAICCMSFNKKNADTFVGGCYNGLLCIWDLRKKGRKCVESTVIEKTHFDPVYGVEWIQSRTGTEFVSVSTDGYIYWWDTRKLKTGPMDSMLLTLGSEEENKSFVHGATSLEYRTDAGATKYLVGTEQGNIICVERKAKKDGESTKAIKCVYGDVRDQQSDESTNEQQFRMAEDTSSHHGPVYSLCRNYFIPKCILSVGDWMCRLWMDDIKTPIMTTRYENSLLTSGIWSRTRPSVFYISKKNGELDIWDFYFKGQYEPALTCKISEQSALTDVQMCTKNDGKWIGVGCEDGSITVLGLCESLYQTQNLNNEKQAIAQLFERETNREKLLQAAKLAQIRKKKLELKAKAKPKQEKNNNSKANDEEERAGGDDEKEFGDDLKAMESDFLAYIENLKQNAK